MIKVLIPSMPTADDLLPYLRQIDESRIYVKGGPLVRRLELELAALVRAPVKVVGNGTVAIELALRALRLPRGSSVLVPAVTFVATGQAILNAGLQPVIAAVEPGTFQLNAETAIDICAADKRIAAVVPVAAFGLAVPVCDWEQFNIATRVPVVIDAAGAIYDQSTSPCTEMLITFSLNATKALGAGEGGAVASCNLVLNERVEALANFGPGGTNARMSEYHAAVALASLRTRPDWRGPIFARYAERFGGPGMGRILGGRQSHRTLLPVLLPPGVNATDVADRLRGLGIETKPWYRPFLDERHEFMHCEKWGPTTYTEILRERLIGLPFHAFLSVDDVDAVCDALAETMA